MLKHCRSISHHSSLIVPCIGRRMLLKFILFSIVSQLLLSPGLFHTSSVHVIIQPQECVASFVPFQFPLTIAKNTMAVQKKKSHRCLYFSYNVAEYCLDSCHTLAPTMTMILNNRAVGSPCLPTSEIITSTERLLCMDITYHLNSGEPPLTTAETFPVLTVFLTLEEPLY